MPKKQKILLIGGSGFIGLHLARSLSSSNEVCIFCKNPGKLRNLAFLKNVQFIGGDVAVYDDVENSVRGKDVIINLASVVNAHADFDAFEDLEVNCRGTINILEARKNINPNSRCIFIGTRAQFGRVKEKELPVSEDYPQNPISLYGIHKSAAESYCGLYKRAFGICSIVLRLPQVYGPSLNLEETHSIIDKFARKAMNGGQVNVYGYGNDLKDLLFVDDFTELIARILKSNVDDGVFNVGSGKKIKLGDIAKKIVAACKSGSFKLAGFPKEKIPFELGSFYFDISKVSREFSWKPKTGIDEGIKKVVDFYKRGEK